MALLLTLLTVAPSFGAQIALLEEGARKGWAFRTAGGVAGVLRDGVLEVRPHDKTRPFARVALQAAPAGSVDARGCVHLTFEVNTLAGTGGVHRAPLLRVGLSDAGGRSRQPLLSRYVQMDTDPTTWQSVLVPLPELLDRSVRAEAISAVTWQYSGPPAPFAIRRVLLMGSVEAAGARAGAGGNLVADPSFERRADARQVWALVGDYRDLAGPGAHTIESGSASHGRRFLRLKGEKACFFESLYAGAPSAGFAVALRGPAAREVEIGCEVVGFGRHGGVSLGGRAVRRVPLEAGWRRHCVSAVVNPSDLPAPEGDLRLYRGWIRPLPGSAAVDADAVHLAATPVEADTFVEARADPLAAATGPYRHLHALMAYRPVVAAQDHPIPPGFQADLPPLSVPLQVREWAGRDWPEAVISGGIPLPRGRLYSPDVLHLVDAHGRDLPLQVEALRHDTRDGSVRCLWLAFAAPLKAGERTNYTLRSAPSAAPAQRPIAAEADGDILVNTGPFRMRLTRDRFPFFAEAEWPEGVLTGGDGGIRLELLDGRVLTSLGRPARVAIERNGPMAAVLSVRGTLAPADKEPAPRFLYDVRLRATRGAPGLQADVAVTNLTPTASVPVRSLGLVVSLRGGRRAQATIGRHGEPDLDAPLLGDQILRVAQRRDPFGAGRPDLFLERPEAPASAAPGQAAGWARWPSPAAPPGRLALGPMAEPPPARQEVRPDGLAATLIPPAGTKAFDFPFGMTASGEFWIGSGESPDVALDRLQRPPFVAADTSFASGAGVFRPFVLPEETRRRFPLLEWVLGRESALWVGDRERLGESNWLGEGDAGSLGLWRHGEPEDLDGLLLQALRTADPLARERLHRQALHAREMGTWWSNESSAFQKSPLGGSHTTYALDPEHFSVTGLLQDYWLTGDRRSCDVADALGAQVLARAGSPRFSATERGRVLLHLAELYGATGRRAYREAYEKCLSRPPVTRPDEEKPGLVALLLGPKDGTYGGLPACALAEGEQALGGTDIEAQMGREFAALGARLGQRRMPATIEAEDGYLDRALSHAPAGAISPAAWSAALEHSCWFLLTPHGRSAALPRSLSAAPAALAAGGAPPAWAAGTPLGVGAYAGSNRSFTVRIRRRDDEPITLHLCRMRRYPPRVDNLCRLRCTLHDPLGKRISAEVLEGDAPEAHPVSLPRRGMTGDYVLLVTCEEDGLVEVISAHPRLFLRADEWKAARATSAAGRFFLRAPATGQVRIALRGNIPPAGDNVAAAVLRSPDGTLLCRTRWAVPIAGTGADGTPPVRAFPDDPLPLLVPPAYRGKPLILEVTTPRAVEWRVEGLDEPWLAAGAGAFS